MSKMDLLITVFNDLDIIIPTPSSILERVRVPMYLQICYSSMLYLFTVFLKLKFSH